MLINALVTKLTLGVVEEDDSDFPRPVVQITMPTVHLMRMVADLHEVFSSKQFKSDSEKMIKSHVLKYFTTTLALSDDSPKAVAKRLPRPAPTSTAG